MDALAIKPQNTKEETLKKRHSVLKDPSTGPIGSISLTAWMLICFASLATISQNSSALIAAAIIPTIEAMSAVKTCMYKSRPTDKGLASLFMPYTSKTIALDYIITLTASAAALSPAYGLTPAIITAAALGLITLLSGIIIRNTLTKTFSYMTGDLLGAAHQIAAAISLIALAAAHNILS